MKQMICNETRGHAAASLYCRWIVVEGSSGTQLVSVWMDPQMRGFEEQMAQGFERAAVGPKNVSLEAGEQTLSRTLHLWLPEGPELTADDIKCGLFHKFTIVNELDRRDIQGTAGKQVC